MVPKILDALHQQVKPHAYLITKRRAAVVAIMLILIVIIIINKSSSQIKPVVAADRTVASDQKFGAQKMAEMTAFARHNETCPEVPPAWSIAFMTLLTVMPPSEDDVEDEEQKLSALRDMIGDAKWCQLYNVEMQEAYFVYQAAARQQ